MAKMAAIVVCVVIAGCGTAHDPASGPTQTTVHVSTSKAATVAANRAAAQAEAARLVALAKLPPGAVRLGRPPAALAGPSAGTPDVASLVDQVVAWRAGLPIAAARKWLAAHPPRGLPADGGDLGSQSAGVTIYGTTYRAPASRAWASAELEISVAPDGPDATAIRVDALIVWLDPRPVPSGPGAHPIRVTVAGGCPPTDQGVTGVTNPGPRLTQQLLPSGPPTAGLRCKNAGGNGHLTWHLVTATRLAGPAARQAAAAMTRLRVSHADPVVTRCLPPADGSAEVLVLAYPGRPDVDLFQLDGCGGVSNGYISAGVGYY
jgi:hypothetical protein